MSTPRVAALLATIVLAAGIFWSCSGPDQSGESEDPAGFEEEVEMTPIRLYFPGSGGQLTREDRELPLGKDPAARVAAILEALLSGPQGAHLESVLPPGTEVAGVYLDAAGVAFVDLSSSASEDPPAMGSMAELLTVFALINSASLNLAEVRRVALLWNGRQRQSFAGHVDTSRPLAPQLDLVADAG